MSTKSNNTVLYAAIPTDPNPNSGNSATQNYVVLPLYPHRHRRWQFFPNLRQLLTALFIILVALSFYLLWPSDPDLRVVRVKLNNIRVRTSPPISLDLGLSLTVRVRNRDLFSLDYGNLSVAVGYRGRELGFVESQSGHVKAKGSSYVDANVLIDGFEVLHDLFYLIEDVASGSVPFDTVSTVKGKLGLFFFQIPIQAKVSCEVYVNPLDQTIIRQNCYPEDTLKNNLSQTVSG